MALFDGFMRTREASRMLAPRTPKQLREVAIRRWCDTAHVTLRERLDDRAARLVCEA